MRARTLLCLPVSQALKWQLVCGRHSITVGWITVAVDSVMNLVEIIHYMSVFSAGCPTLWELPRR